MPCVGPHAHHLDKENNPDVDFLIHVDFLILFYSSMLLNVIKIVME